MRDGQKIRQARRLRQSANAPEAIAWDSLRQLRKFGVVVRRQHPVGRFIADFAIVKAKLIIEVDGGIHHLTSAKLRDEEREGELASLGWRVVRVSPEVAMSRDHLLALVQRELGL